MEVDPGIIASPLFERQEFQRQIDLIKKASEIAQKKIDYHSAHNEEVLCAIEVVENFLRKKHRLCYGGQAINAHLPTKYKIYNSEYTLPDYDFFTPDQRADIQTLVKDLQRAGFTEISAREGMHEGTVKIYVNFVPVADITQINPSIYKVLSNREYKYDGISYLDANTLRMLMYLELSRPRGEVERWAKVYERLALFNEFIPVRKCTPREKKGNKVILTRGELELIMSFIIEQKNIFAGGDLVGFYDKKFKHKQIQRSWTIRQKLPIFFFSSSFDADAEFLVDELRGIEPNDSFTIKNIKSKGLDLTPSITIIQRDEKPIIFIIDSNACSSYYNYVMKTEKGQEDMILRIASLDTLITLYFSLALFDNKYINAGSMECLANELVELSIAVRNNPDNFPFPFISLKCSGHQPSLASLIREKVRRITRKRSAKSNKIKRINQSTNTNKSYRRISIKK